MVENSKRISKRFEQASLHPELCRGHWQSCWRICGNLWTWETRRSFITFFTTFSRTSVFSKKKNKKYIFLIERVLWKFRKQLGFYSQSLVSWPSMRGSIVFRKKKWSQTPGLRDSSKLLSPATVPPSNWTMDRGCGVFLTLRCTKSFAKANNTWKSKFCLKFSSICLENLRDVYRSLKKWCRR